MTNKKKKTDSPLLDAYEQSHAASIALAEATPTVRCVQKQVQHQYHACMLRAAAVLLTVGSQNVKYTTACVGVGMQCNDAKHKHSQDHQTYGPGR